MEIIYRIVLLFSCKLILAIWLPEIKFSPNFDQFQIYRSHFLDNIIFSSIDEDIRKDFQWQSVASTSLSFNKASYVIYAGSQHVKNNSTSGFSKKDSSVFICELLFSDSLMNFSSVQCNKVETGEKNWNIGVANEAISLSDKEAVLVYCDPLWHVANLSEPKPSGKCYLDVINDRKRDRKTSIEFCRLSPTSFLSCLGGFSVDLISTNKRISGIHMVVGMPYLPPYGSVKIVNDPFNSKTINDPRNGIGKYFNFGYAVSMKTMSVIYASSPLSDHYGPNVTNVRQDVVLTSPDNIPFSSFGLSLKTLSIAAGQNHAVAVGAPFHSVKAVQNVGKVYVFCVSHESKGAILAAELHGDNKDEFYGYAVANIGDINGDGNEDLAISSPFLRDDNSKGFVSIYTVSDICGVTLEQVIRSAFSDRAGVFGISVTGGSDLDFNSWPDLVVLNSRSNSIELYASRTRFKAKCKFSPDNLYDTELLQKDAQINIKVFVSLLDIRKNNNANLDVIKSFSLISQIDPNFNTTEKRFSLETEKTKISFMSTSLVVDFSIKSLMDVKKMNLSMPVVVAYRLLEDCSRGVCNILNFPLIDWQDCKMTVPLKKYICLDSPTCDADLSIQLIDSQGTEVIYGHDVTFSRSLQIKISNNGPTTAKDINFKISTNQNLRIHKVTASLGVTLKDSISENQTEAVCRFDTEEIEVNTTIQIGLDIYFVDFKNVATMKYVNNFIAVKLFSDVRDPNVSNNRAQVTYTFVYEPKITFSGSPPKDTIIDSRNRSQLIYNGQRLPIDSVGPMLSHDYIIDNSGNSTVTNVIVTISVPVQTVDGYRLMYLFDKIRGVNKSEAVWMDITPQVFIGVNRYPCTLPHKYVNPLSLIGFENHVLHLRSMDIRQMGDWTNVVRRKRSAANESNVVSSSNSKEKNILTEKKMYRIPVERVQCDKIGVILKSPVCPQIICKIPILPPKKQARIQVNAWLWAYTFFKKQISDIRVYTTMHVNFHSLPEGVQLKWDKDKIYSQSQQIIFQNVKPKITHFKPWWPIIVGIVIGILILAILIVAMYKCGFFQRHKIRRHRSSKKGVHQPIIRHPGDL